MPPDIPSEIIELIVDLLPVCFSEEECMRTLQSCRLLSHSFNHPARRLQFSSLKLSFIEPPPYHHKVNTFARAGLVPTSELLAYLQAQWEQNHAVALTAQLSATRAKMEEIYTLFERSPVVASYIRTVHIDLHDSMILQDQSQLHVVLNSLSASASKLHTMRLTSKAQTSLSWHSGTTMTQAAFTALIQLPRMTAIRFAMVNFPTSIITLMPSLRSLELVDAKLYTAIPVPPQAHRFEKLHVHDYVAEFHRSFNVAFGRPPTFRNLELFVGDQEDVTRGRLLIRDSAEALEALKIGLQTKNVDHLGLINVGRLPRLRTLSLKLQNYRRILDVMPNDFDDSMFPAMRPLGAVFTILRPMTMPTSLTQIDIEIRMVTRHCVPTRLFADNDKTWHALCPSVLIVAHPLLAKISVSVYWTFQKPLQPGSESAIANEFRSVIQTMVFDDGPEHSLDVHLDLTTKIDWVPNTVSNLGTPSGFGYD